MQDPDRSKWVRIGLLAILTLVFASVALVAGTYDISVGEAYDVVYRKIGLADASNIEKLHNTIVWEIRLPRIILALSVGIALASSGAVFQGVFRNPLVEPYILGVSSGAAFGAALGIVYPQIVFSVQAGAFLFALIAVGGAYRLATFRGETPILTLILSGVVLGSIFTAGVSIMKYTATDSALREIVFWLMGGFYYATWKEALIVAPIVLFCFVVTWLLGWKLNVLSMGDNESRTLGINPERYKLAFIGLATLVSAVSVSAVGIIAWVGLMAPHAARMLIGPDHRFLLPASALMGGSYLIVCDTIARTATTAEIPVGIITSIIGAPYLIYLLRNKGGKIF